MVVDYVSGQLMRDYIKIGKKTLDEAAKLTEQNKKAARANALTAKFMRILCEFYSTIF